MLSASTLQPMRSATVMGQYAGGGGSQLRRVLHAHPNFSTILDSLRSDLLQVHESALLDYKNELATALDSVERAAGVPPNTPVSSISGAGATSPNSVANSPEGDQTGKLPHCTLSILLHGRLEGVS